MALSSVRMHNMLAGGTIAEFAVRAKSLKS
jgi:hypothetical protein